MSLDLSTGFSLCYGKLPIDRYLIESVLFSEVESFEVSGEIFESDEFQEIHKKFFLLGKKIFSIHEILPKNISRNWSDSPDNIKKELINLNNTYDTIDNFFALKDYLYISNDIINNVIINNLVNKLNYSYLDNLIYISVIYNNYEVNSFNYFNICFLFFAKINIKISNKTIKEFINFINKKNNTKFFINKDAYINKNFNDINDKILEFYINN